MAIVVRFWRRRRATVQLPFKTVWELMDDLKHDKVSQISIGQSIMHVFLRHESSADSSSSTPYQVLAIPAITSVLGPQLVKFMQENKIPASVLSPETGILTSILPLLLLCAPFIYLGICIYFLRNMNNRGNKVGKLTSKDHNQVTNLPTFADVAGIAQAKSEMQSVVELLRDPQRYRFVGARQPRGILLVRCICALLVCL